MYASDFVELYRLLADYYGREYGRATAEDFEALSRFAHLDLACAYPSIATAFEEIAGASKADMEDFKYEFNRLFVGPDKVPAAPYETVYLSPERTLMRQHTLGVRDAYLQAGLQVDKKNVEPDDHISYECAFIIYLLEKAAGLHTQVEGTKALEPDEARNLLADFVDNHLRRWVPLHVEAVEDNTKNALCRGFAHVLEAVYMATAAEYPIAEAAEEA